VPFVAAGFEMAKKFRKASIKQIKQHRRQVDKHGPEHHPARSSKIAKYERLIQELGELLVYLRWQESRARLALAGRSQTQQQRRRVVFLPCDGTLSESLKLTRQHDARYDLSDLPPELLKELSEEATRGVAHPLIEIIDGRGGTATLDEILIDLYRRYKKVGKRASVAQRLSVLSRRGLCRLVSGATGHYTTAKLDRCEMEETKEPLENSKTTP
jgi:hypothetical protein